MNEALGPGAAQPQQPGIQTKEHRLAEAARNEAERSRQLAEEARETAETTRVANEEARVAADTARQGVVDAVHIAADRLSTTLEHMKVVEDLRRTLAEIGNVKKVDPN